MNRMNVLIVLCFMTLSTIAGNALANADKSTTPHPAKHSKNINSSQFKARHGIKAVKAAKENPATKDTIKHGSWLYGVYCNHCHGLKGEGDGPAAKYLGTKPANLTKLSSRFPSQHFFLRIALGKGKMPTWGDTLEEKELWALTHYIQTLAPKK